MYNFHCAVPKKAYPFDQFDILSIYGRKLSFSCRKLSKLVVICKFHTLKMVVNMNNRLKSMLREIINLTVILKPYLRSYIFIIIFTVLLTLLDLGLPYVNKLMIDEVAINRNFNMLFIVISLYVIIFIFFKVLSIAKLYLLSYVGNLMSFNLRRNIFKKILNKKESAETIDIGNIYVTFEQDILPIQDFILGRVIDLCINIFNIIVLSYIILSMSWQFYLISIISIPLTNLNNKYWFEKVLQKSHAQRKAISNMFSFVTEAFSNSKNIKTMAMQKYVERKFVQKNKNMIKAIFSNLKINWIISVISESINLIQDQFVLFIGMFLVYKGTLTLGDYFALSTYRTKFSGNLLNIINLKLGLTEVVVATERLGKTLNLEQEETNQIKISKIEGNLEIKNVNFSYPNSFPLLENFNLTIKKGEKIAFVGENGSGKSTIINLLLGIYEPISGEILIDGQNIKNINLNSYRKKIGYVAQESFFLNDSIKENLTLGKKVYIEQIKKVSQICHLDFITATPEGIEKTLDVGGGNISGGQKQRLSLARIMLKNAEMIFLDEATSAIDNINEEAILKNFKKEIAGKTTIAVAHKLSTIMDFDKIVALQNGKIVEIGTHDELMEKQGYYYKLVKISEQGVN